MVLVLVLLQPHVELRSGRPLTMFRKQGGGKSWGAGCCTERLLTFCMVGYLY